MPQRASSLVFSADGSVLAAEWQDEVTVLDAARGRLLHRLAGQISHMASAHSPDGKTLGFRSENDNSVTLWDIRTAQKLLTIDVADNRVTHLLFAPRGDRLFAAGLSRSDKGRVWEWTVRQAED